MKKLILLRIGCLLVLGLVWLTTVVFSAGTTSNTHWIPDVDHESHSPHLKIYAVRLDSGIAWGTAADSNQIIASWVTPWVDLGVNRVGFMYVFRVTRIDTTLTINDNDSIWISVETTTNPNSWYPDINTIHEFTPLNDTGTCAKHFPACSATVQTQTGYVRTEIVYHAWQDSLDHGSILDTLTHVPMLFEETIIPVD